MSPLQMVGFDLAAGFEVAQHRGFEVGAALGQEGCRPGAGLVADGETGGRGDGVAFVEHFKGQALAVGGG